MAQDQIAETKEIVLVDFRSLPEYAGARERQEALVKGNPFVPVADSSSYNEARKNRTALRQGRYELQNGKKVINAKLNEFKKAVDAETTALINITLPHEEKQQTEVERWEDVKKKEKEEKERIERERVEGIKNSIIDFRRTQQQNLRGATHSSIGTVIELITSYELKCLEFQSDFEMVKEQLLEQANEKKEQLDEAERIRLENERLAEERRKLKEEQEKQEEARHKAREKQEAELKAEREKIEADRKAQEEKLRKEREEIEAERKRIAQEEADKKAKEEADRKAKEEEELKAIEEEQRIAREKAEKKRQAALKPDKEKLLKVIKSLSIDLDPSVTTFKDKAAEQLAYEYVEKADLLTKEYINKVNNL